MQTHIQKWGNSFGLRIPIQYLRELHLESGAMVDISLEDDHLLIKPHRDNLDFLLSQITPENLHGEAFEEDEPKGKEIW
jgi:antitoxin MazE